MKALKLSYLLSVRFRKSQRNSGLMGFMAKSSSLGILLGVTVLIVALSVVNGFQQQLVERLLSLVPHVEYVSADGYINDWQVKQQRLEQQRNVLAAAPFIGVNAMAQSKGQLEAAQLRGIDPALESKVSIVNQFISEADLSALQSGQLIMGAELAKKLSVTVGDTISLLMTDLHNKEKGLAAPVRYSAEVVGLITSHGPLDKQQVFMRLDDMQSLFDLSDDQVTGLRITLDDVFSAETEAMRIGRTLDDYVYVNSWVRTQGSLYQDIQMVRTIVYLSVFLIISVASFNIISSLFMEVKEKQSAIAILRTMGAGDFIIMQTFLLQGVVSAIFAIAFGCVLGLFLAINITDIFVWWSALIGENKLAGVYFIDFLPSKIQWQDVIWVSSITLAITVVASIYPAWQAAKVDPAKVLGN